MLADLILLGPAGAKVWAKMGATLAEDRLKADFIRHHALVRLRSCLISGCRSELRASGPHSWTCEEHDPLRRVAARVAAEVAK